MRKITLAALIPITVFLPFACYAEGFFLSSPDIKGQISNTHVFNGFGCRGDNISPALLWENAPPGTKSFAVTSYDPAAPTGGGWWHWLIFDIPASVSALERGAGNVKSSAAPKGSIQSITSFGQRGFGGSCPPQGNPPHPYIFTVFALKVERLGLDAEATPAMVGYYLNTHLLAKASIIAYYRR